MDELEWTFAFAVAKARGSLTLSTADIPTISDLCESALATLWTNGERHGLTTGELDTIAQRYVCWTAQGVCPRPSLATVTPFFG